MSDAEWAFFEPFVVETGPRRGRRPRDHRLVLDGVFWIARTGAAWRDLHSHFGTWNSVYRQFRRWTQAGTWDVMLEALNETGDLEAQIGTFIEHYNHVRYHESLDNVTLADAYFGRATEILRRRPSVKRQTLQHRRLQHRKIAA